MSTLFKTQFYLEQCREEQDEVENYIAAYAYAARYFGNEWQAEMAIEIAEDIGTVNMRTIREVCEAHGA